MFPTKFIRPLALCLVLTSIFLSIERADAAPPALPTLYGTTAGTSAAGQLYIVNPFTGTATFVANLVDGSANPYAVTGLGLDGATGVLYGSTSNNSATAPSSLVTINPATGLVTEIGSFGIAGGTMADLTFDSANSVLYGANSANANLYTINTTTGAATLVGASGISLTPPPTGMGLAQNSSGVVFGAPKNANGNLFTYNTTSGAATSGPLLAGAPFGASGSINALAFGSSVLYGVDLNRSDSTTPRGSDLITINTTTGAVTDIGAIMDISGNIPFFDSLEFVPEPSTWLAAALSLGALILTQKRRFTRRVRR